MVQRRDQARFAPETLEELRRRGEPRRQHFDRDESIEPAVAPAVHFAHAAGAEQVLELVRPEPCSRLNVQGAPPPPHPESYGNPVGRNFAGLDPDGARRCDRLAVGAEHGMIAPVSPRSWFIFARA